ncbi:AMP-binding protein, partial [Nocardia wallacei]|uniref:AMP-binding protein n=1 Tax=Nocardia wallacei TaxID=480035 RepID=UPI002458F37A
WGGVLAGLESQPEDISHLRTWVVGGSAVPPAMMRAFQEKHGVRLLHAWGMTETSPLGAALPPPPTTPNPPPPRRKTVVVG